MPTRINKYKWFSKMKEEVNKSYRAPKLPQNVEMLMHILIGQSSW